MWNFRQDFNSFMIDCNKLFKDSTKTLSKNYSSNFSKQILNMNNQYYLIISLPDFNIISNSENIKEIFPNITGNLMNIIANYYQNSFEACFTNFSTSIKNLIVNSDTAIPFDVLFSSILKISLTNSSAEHFLNQVCLFEKNLDKGILTVLIQFTNIEVLKSIFTQHSCPLLESQLKHNHDINIDNELFSQFTSRELEILELLQSGRSSVEIADFLSISKHTVDTHRRKMISKSNVCNTAELIAFCISQKTNISQ